MKLVFLFIGGHKEPWLSSLTEQYQKKLSPFYSCEIIRLKPTKLERSSRLEKQRAESDALCKHLQKDDCVILCDEAGELLNSPALSKKLVRFFESGKARVVFVIGGAYGFSDGLKARASWLWSFSPLTFNHHIAQAVLLEQVYRAMAIWKNLPYHND